MKYLLTVLLAMVVGVVYSQTTPTKMIVRFNTITEKLQAYQGGDWKDLDFARLVDISAGVDSITFSNDTLYLYQGEDAPLKAEITGGLKTFEISNDTLYANSLFVLLASYLDNTDAQTITFDTATAQLSITGGNTISLDGLFAKGSGSAATIPMWVAWDSLGNSAITQSGQEITMGLTGSITVPSGTDAQVPVWGAGKLRYNTTAGGFQGGANGYYLPWAVTPNFTAGSVLFATTNGRIQQDNSSLFFDNANNHFGIQTSSPAYHFHVAQYADWRFGGTLSSQEYFGYSGSGTTLVLNKLGFQQNNFSGTGTSNRFNNTNVNGNGIQSTAYFHSFIGSRNGPALVVSPNLDNNASTITSEEVAMSFWPKSISVDIDIIDNNFGVNGGHIVEWRDQTFIIGQIVPVITRRVTDTLDVKWIIRGHSDNSLTNFLEIEKGEIIAPIYGSGNISGTHAYTASFNSSGRLIEVPEKWGAISTSTDGSGDITVAHGMGTTPTSVQVTVTGTTPYVVTVHTIDATNFTVRFYDMTGAAVTSTAVTATWHCKT